MNIFLCLVGLALAVAIGFRLGRRGNKEVVEVAAPAMPAPLPPIESNERTLPDFLDRLISSLQETGVSYVDATVYSPRFNELAELRVQLLGRKPRLH